MHFQVNWVANMCYNVDYRAHVYMYMVVNHNCCRYWMEVEVVAKKDLKLVHSGRAGADVAVLFAEFDPVGTGHMITEVLIDTAPCLHPNVCAIIYTLFLCYTR